MVEIQSKEVIDKISDELKVQPALEIPRTLAKDIQLVYDVNTMPKVFLKAGTLSDSAGPTAIHTTSSERDTFITFIDLTLAKDVVSDSIVTQVLMVIDGKATAPALLLRYEPVTAGQFNKGIIFNPPIKLERGSSITITHSQATASIDASAVVGLYETDPQ